MCVVQLGVTLLDHVGVISVNRESDELLLTFLSCSNNSRLCFLRIHMAFFDGPCVSFPPGLPVPEASGILGVRPDSEDQFPAEMDP